MAGAPAPPDLPHGMTVEAAGDRLVLVRRWFSRRFFVLAVLALGWNGILAAFYGFAIQTGAWMLALFGLVHGLVGFALAYGAVAGLFNRTRITLDGRTLSVRHGPVPWWGARDVPVEQVDQLYVLEQHHQGQSGSRFTYRLVAALHEGEPVVLVRNLESPEAARAMEARLEPALGIVDRPVPGEYRPGERA